MRTLFCGHLNEVDGVVDKRLKGEGMVRAEMLIIAGCLLVVGNTVQAQGAAHEGPKKVWQSEPIPAAKEGAYGSVVVVTARPTFLSA